MQHNDEKIEKNNEAKPSAATASDADKSPSTRSYFPIPTPLKRIFDSCPLITYPANALPVRAPRQRDVHTLYIFTSEAGARTGAPSFNPSCLKWQVSPLPILIILPSSPAAGRERHSPYITQLRAHQSLIDVRECVDLPPPLRRALPHRRVKQPCVAVRRPAVPDSGCGRGR